MKIRKPKGWIGIASLAVVFIGSDAVAGSPPVPYPTVLKPGTSSETSFLSSDGGTTVAGGVRHAEAGQAWTYSFVVAPRENYKLEITLSDATNDSVPEIIILSGDNKPIPVRIDTSSADKNVVRGLWNVPANWPFGSHMGVTLKAKSGATNIKQLRFSALPENGDLGIPVSVFQIMTQGLPPNTRPTVFKTPSRPFTSFQSGHGLDPKLDLITDAIFAYTDNPQSIMDWKQRGYTVWTMGGARAGKSYAAQHPGEAQTDANGNAITIGGDSVYFSPTAGRIAQERSYFERALNGGSEGVIPEEPEYFARAGYEGAFKTAWRNRYSSPWIDPASSVQARWQAGQLMAKLETDHISSLLEAAADIKPGARRMAALHSPINYADWGIVSPQYAISRLTSVQEVIGQVWTGTARTPVRYAGIRQDLTFSNAYLEYSSLYHLMRGTGKKLWFLMDPLEDDPTRAQSDYKSHYEQTLIAALLFPEVDAYEVMPWPERVYGQIPAEYATEINTIIAALQDMHNQPSASGNAILSGGIGVFASDSMQWQREKPAKSDFDGFYGLTLPLLQYGVPVQVVSLDRAAEPGYLRPFKTLILSYDFQKPPSREIHTALSDWVHAGGSLIFVGGSDDYNSASSSWWRQAQRETPQADLFSQLGLITGQAVKVSGEPIDMSSFKPVMKGNTASRNLENRRIYAIDLSPFAKETGSAAVRFGDVTPQDAWGAWVSAAELRINGKLAASFRAGSDLENRFIVADSNSQYSEEARFADGKNFWVYQFDNLPKNASVTLSVDMGNGFEVSASSVKPEAGHTLINAKALPSVDKIFPRLRIGAAYPATIYSKINSSVAVDGGKNAPPVPSSLSDFPTPLYSLRSGGAPVWMRNVEKGLVLNVGVAPGFFSASERSAGFLRSLVRYATQRAGGSYREADALLLKRGRYSIVRTFDDVQTVEGRTIDLLSANLSVAEDREIPAHSLALLYDLGSADAPPHIGYVSGRVQAKMETQATTSFFVRGPLGTGGIARIHAGSHHLKGARAMDRYGRQIDLQATAEGATVALRYPNDPDGIVIRLGWD